MTHLSEKDLMFIEFAVSDKLISSEQAEFINKDSNQNLSEILIAQGVSPQNIADIYQKVEDKIGSNSKVRVAKVNTNDALDEKMVALAKAKNLISDEDITSARKQLQSLYDLGYNPQLSSVLYSAKCLSKEDLVTLCREASNSKVKTVEEALPFADLALPVIPKIGVLKRKSSHEIVGLSSEAVRVMEKMEEIIPPQIDISKEIANSVEEEKESVIEELHQDSTSKPQTQIEKQEEQQPMMPLTSNDVPSVVIAPEMIRDIGRILEYVQKIEEKVVHLQKEQAKPIVSESFSHEEMEEKFESEDISDDVKKLIKKLTFVSEEEAQIAIQEGMAIENSYIPKISCANPIVVKKVSFSNCIIDVLDIGSVEFKNSVNLSNCHFLSKTIFRESKFHKDLDLKNCEFHNGGDFTKAQFEGKTTFNSTAFRRFVGFNRSQFGKKTVFTRSYFAKGVKYGEVDFRGTASFNDIYVDHRFYMEKCKFQDDSTFSGARFADIADFGRSTFEKEVKFIGSIFMKWGSFKNCKFKGNCNFNAMNIVGDLAFDNSTFSGLLNLRALSASRNVSLQNIKIEQDTSFTFLDAHIGRLFMSLNSLKGHLDSHVQEDYLTARKEYGLLKNNFREINEYDKEDWAYLMEKRMERMAIKVRGPFSATKRFFNWLALDVACGYGTKPVNIFIASIIALVFFASFFFYNGTQFVPSSELVMDDTYVGNAMSFIESIQVSFRTFTNASIEGWVPFTKSWMNYIMMIESFFGFFVMTVLVVTFSRKVIR